MIDESRCTGSGFLMPSPDFRAILTLDIESSRFTEKE